MRLDKYLKTSRIVKRRTLAKELCDQGRVTVNGKVAKSGSELHVGDILSVRFGEKTLHLRVEELRETSKKEEAAGMYTILQKEPNP